MGPDERKRGSTKGLGGIRIPRDPEQSGCGTCPAKASAEGPDSTAAAAWPASGPGSQPSHSPSCTGSSSLGPGPTASRRKGGAKRNTPSPSTASDSNQTGGGVGRPQPMAPRKSMQLRANGQRMAGAPCPPQPLAIFPQSSLTHLQAGERWDKDLGLPLHVPHRGSWKGKGGPGPHPGPAAAPVSQAGLEMLGSASAVSSLSPAWGMSRWRHHMIHH